MVRSRLNLSLTGTESMKLDLYEAYKAQERSRGRRISKPLIAYDSPLIPFLFVAAIACIFIAAHLAGVAQRNSAKKHEVIVHVAPGEHVRVIEDR